MLDVVGQDRRRRGVRSESIDIRFRPPHDAVLVMRHHEVGLGKQTGHGIDLLIEKLLKILIARRTANLTVVDDMGVVIRNPQSARIWQIPQEFQRGIFMPNLVLPTVGNRTEFRIAPLLEIDPFAQRRASSVGTFQKDLDRGRWSADQVHRTAFVQHGVADRELSLGKSPCTDIEGGLFVPQGVESDVVRFPILGRLHTEVGVVEA